MRKNEIRAGRLPMAALKPARAVSSKRGCSSAVRAGTHKSSVLPSWTLCHQCYNAKTLASLRDLIRTSDC